MTYTIEVTNTGDVGLDPSVPVDDKCAPLELHRRRQQRQRPPRRAPTRAARRPGSTPARGPSGLPAPPATTDINTVTVSGVDPLGNTYDDERHGRGHRASTRPSTWRSPSVTTLVPAGSTVDYAFDGDQHRPEPGRRPTTSWHGGAGRRHLPGQPGVSACRLLSPRRAATRTTSSTGSRRRPGVYACQGTIDRKPPSTWRAVRATGWQHHRRARSPCSTSPPPRCTAFHPGIEVDQVGEPRPSWSAPVRSPTPTRCATPETCRWPASRTGSPTTPARPWSTSPATSDRDGLLDTPNSIFEDSLDETWIFTCTTFVDEDTTNTVVVGGTAVGPGRRAAVRRRADARTRRCSTHLRAHGPRPRPRHRHARETSAQP